mmetsp:Transcript_58909/g.129319  ORF Transcript_58909/g.129319 Transcript_58909/m.129319 type:complete len:84 (+) Transcript_58909:1294-1545(+)
MLPDSRTLLRMVHACENRMGVESPNDLCCRLSSTSLVSQDYSLLAAFGVSNNLRSEASNDSFPTCWELEKWNLPGLRWLSASR